MTLVALGLGREAFTAVPNWLTWRTRIGIQYGHTEATVSRLHRLPPSFHRAEGVGAVMTRLDRSIQGLVGALSEIAFNAPVILILDEPTSALDAESEALVQDGLARVSRRRTTLIIAHRLSTVVDADRIVVLREGKIVEQGRHAELLGRGGHYASLVEKQPRGRFPLAA